jgi:hypothetical protein
MDEADVQAKLLQMLQGKESVSEEERIYRVLQ